MTKIMLPTNRPTVHLIGADSNAFTLLGLCQRAARKAGWTPEEIAAFRDEATAGDHDHLLATIMEHFQDASEDDSDTDAWA